MIITKGLNSLWFFLFESQILNFDKKNGYLYYGKRGSILHKILNVKYLILMVWTQFHLYICFQSKMTLYSTHILSFCESDPYFGRNEFILLMKSNLDTISIVSLPHPTLLSAHIYIYILIGKQMCVWRLVFFFFESVPTKQNHCVFVRNLKTTYEKKAWIRWKTKKCLLQVRTFRWKNRCVWHVVHHFHIPTDFQCRGNIDTYILIPF